MSAFYRAILSTCRFWRGRFLICELSSTTSASHLASREFEPWGTLLTRAARAPNVYAKISGLDTGDGERSSALDLAPYVDHALEMFKPERLMIGSDWPVAVIRGGYRKVWQEMQTVLARVSQDERDRIMGGTAIDVYRLPIAPF